MTDSELLDWLEAEAKKSYTGISFDWVPKFEGESGGFRFMRQHFISEPVPALRKAIELAMFKQQGKELGPSRTNEEIEKPRSRSLAKASAYLGRMIPQPKKRKRK